MGVLGPLFAAWIALHGSNPSHGGEIGAWMLAHTGVENVITNAAKRHFIPPALLLVVGILETRLDTDRPNEGAFGMRPSIVRGHCRHPDRVTCTGDAFAVQAEVAAYVLSVGRSRCGSWRGAGTYLRWGYCDPEKDYSHYGERARDYARAIDRHGTWDTVWLAPR